MSLKDLFNPKKLLRVAVGVGLFFVGGGSGALIAKSIGANLILGAVLDRKPKSLRGRQEMRAMVRSAIVPQEVCYGRPPRKGGVITWFGTSNLDRRYLWHVVTVCAHEIDGFESLWIDDVEIDIATQVNIDNEVTHPDFVNADGARLVRAWFYTGTDAQTASPELMTAFPVEWGADHRGRGVAYFVTRMELDESKGGTDPDNPDANVWNKGVPRELSVTIRGKKVYDPRLDSTNGGAGAHRVADESTWAWSSNPILQRADYLRSTRFGPGFAAAEINWSLVASQSNVCDQLTDLPGATTQKRYESHGIIVTEDTPKQVIESMHTADHGTTVIRASGAHLYAGAWAAPAHTIDGSWLAGGVGMVSATEADDAYNAVRGQYLQGDAQAVEFQPKLAPAYETEDGGFRSWRDIVLLWTTDEYMAQRLAIVELKKSRQQTVVNLACNYRAELVQVWETVTLSLPELGTGTFRVIGKSSEQDGTVSLSLRQEVESDWTYTVPELAAPPIVPTVTRNPAGVPAPSGLSASTVGEGIRLEWTLPNMASVSHIEVYASATNDRSAAVLVTRTASESFLHALAATTVRYYWILARGYNGVVSTWHPVGAVDGVMGTAGAAGQGPQGDPGESAVEGFADVTGAVSWVRAQDGTTWSPTSTTSDVTFRFRKDGIDVARVGRRITRAQDGLLTVSTIAAAGGDQNTARVTLTVTGGGTRAVSITATYDFDGSIKTVAQGWSATLSGTDGTDGDDAIEGFAAVDGPASWVRATDGLTWSPTATTSDVDWTFTLGGVAVARISRRVTRSVDGLLTVTTTTHPGGDLNTARVSITTNGAGTRAVTLQATYNFGGHIKTIAQSLSASLSGINGTNGTNATSEQNTASGVLGSLTLTGHQSSGNQVSISANCSFTGTTTSTSPNATWAYRLQRRINGGAWTILTTWTGEESSNIRAFGPFTWNRETEFTPHQFIIGSNGALSFTDTPTAGSVDYQLSWSTTPSGLDSPAYTHNITTFELTT